MQKKLVLEFTKMHGAGNDFIVVDNRFYYFSDAELADLAQRLCRRRYGIGADGVLALSPHAEWDFHMRYFNADGSNGEMCGNGARCLARFAQYVGLPGSNYRFLTDAGPYQAQVPDAPDADVRLFTPAPEAYTPKVPVTLPAGAAFARMYGIDTGVPHGVCFVDDVAAIPVAEWGPPLRHDAAFPRGANIDFVQVLDTPGHIRVRTYERGVEQETLACGTGALAAAFVARLSDRVQTDAVSVHMPGGTLRVGSQLSKGVIAQPYLEGPATMVYRGTVEV